MDLTLALDGVEVDMGTAMNATHEDSNAACLTNAINIPADAARWREVLGTAMTAAGFVNYEPE